MVDTDFVVRLREELKGVDGLCAPSPHKLSSLSVLLKDLYDHSSDAAPGKRFGPLSALTVEGMDLESLWEQLQTRNRPLLRFIKKKTSSLFQALKVKQQQQRQQQQQQQQTHSRSKNLRRGVAQRDEEEEEEEEEEEDEEGQDERPGLDSDDYEDDDREDVDDDKEQPQEGGQVPTDNDFLDDMNAWLDEGEEREELRERKMQRREQLQAHKGADEYDDSDTEEDDEEYVQRELYSEKGAEEPKFMYSDFFGSKSAPNKRVKTSRKTGKGQEQESDEDDDEEMDEQDEDEEEEEDGDEDEEDDAEEGDEEDEGGAGAGKAVPQTSHQRHKAQLASQIKQLEAELIGPKSWELRGEVKGSDRPENSLLGVTADIERASKPAPIVTQEYTSSLEDLIRQRIDDERWDDVVPPPVRELLPQAASDLFLSQERSQTGLGDIYAQEFLSKTMSVNKSDEEAKREEHATVELKTLFHKICRQLDALSHFHYTPRPVVPEASISTAAVPSISLEDIIPSTVSGAQAMAPEEVHQKKRGREAALLSEAELTSEDRKRLRRASKSTRRKQLRSENQQNEAASRVGKASKRFEDKKLDAALRSDSRVIDGAGAEGTGHKFSKSAAFFGNMQKQAQSNISDTKKASAAKKNQKSGGGPTTSARVKL